MNLFTNISIIINKIITSHDNLIDYYIKPELEIKPDREIKPYYDIEAQVKIQHKRFMFPSPFWVYYSNDKNFDDDDEFD